MKVKISGKWLSYRDFEETGMPETIFLEGDWHEAVFNTSGTFTAKIDGEIDMHLVPYWGESKVWHLVGGHK